MALVFPDVQAALKTAAAAAALVILKALLLQLETAVPV
jgi:hypothetical protein